MVIHLYPAIASYSAGPGFNPRGSFHPPAAGRIKKVFHGRFLSLSRLPAISGTESVFHVGSKASRSAARFISPSVRATEPRFSSQQATVDQSTIVSKLTPANGPQVADSRRRRLNDRIDVRTGPQALIGKQFRAPLAVELPIGLRWFQASHHGTRRHRVLTTRFSLSRHEVTPISPFRGSGRYSRIEPKADGRSPTK